MNNSPLVMEPRENWHRYERGEISAQELYRLNEEVAKKYLKEQSSLPLAAVGAQHEK